MSLCSSHHRTVEDSLTTSSALTHSLLLDCVVHDKFSLLLPTAVGGVCVTGVRNESPASSTPTRSTCAALLLPGVVVLVVHTVRKPRTPEQHQNTTKEEQRRVRKRTGRASPAENKRKKDIEASPTQSIADHAAHQSERASESESEGGTRTTTPQQINAHNYEEEEAPPLILSLPLPLPLPPALRLTHTPPPPTHPHTHPHRTHSLPSPPLLPLTRSQRAQTLSVASSRIRLFLSHHCNVCTLYY